MRHIVLEVQTDNDTSYTIHEGRRKVMRRMAAVISYSGSKMRVWWKYTRNNMQTNRYDIDAWTERMLNGDRDGCFEEFS